MFFPVLKKALKTIELIGLSPFSLLKIIFKFSLVCNIALNIDSLPISHALV